MKYTLLLFYFIGFSCSYNSTSCSENSLFNDITIISQKEFIENNEVLQQKIKKALKDGIFCIEIPENIHPYLPQAIEFANNFYKDEKIKNFKLPGIAVAGYIKPQEEQVETFFCIQPFWSQIFSLAVQNCAHQMVLFTTDIINKIRASVFPEINNDTLDVHLKSLFSGTARYTLNLSYYEPSNENKFGANIHQDVGYLTMILTNKKGLCALINDEAKYIPVLPNHLIINLGTAFEILVNDHEKLTAPIHWVEAIKDEPKISIILRTHTDLNIPVYRHNVNGNFEIAYQTYAKYYQQYQGEEILALVTKKFPTYARHYQY